MAEIQVNGKTYIRSKDAANAVGYTQDYVGQLARKGEVDAVRESSMWYINLESLKAHKRKAGEYVPTPPPRPFTGAKGDMFVTFDGKEYISTARAAKITGYTQDYVAQLARSQRVSSRQVGTRWYVDKEKLVSHKEENDAKLAALQAESAGVKRTQSAGSGAQYDTEGPQLQYFSELPNHLLPQIPQKSHESWHKENVEAGIQGNDEGDDFYRVPSSFIQETLLDESEEDGMMEEETSTKRLNAPHIAFLGASAVIVALMVMGSFHAFSSSVIFVRGGSEGHTAQSKTRHLIANVIGAMQSIPLPTKSIRYSR